MPLRIIESNKGGKILVDETSRTYGLVLTKKTNPPHTWYCKNKQLANLGIAKITSWLNLALQK